MSISVSTCVICNAGERTVGSIVPTYRQNYEGFHVPIDKKENRGVLVSMKMKIAALESSSERQGPP